MGLAFHPWVIYVVNWGRSPRVQTPLELLSAHLAHSYFVHIILCFLAFSIWFYASIMSLFRLYVLTHRARIGVERTGVISGAEE